MGCSGDGGSGRGRGGAGERAGEGDPAEGLPGTGGGRLRLPAAGQSPLAGPAHGQLPHRGRVGDHSHPVRVLRAGGPNPASQHAGPGGADAQPQARDPGHRAYHVRRPHAAFGGGGGRGAEALPGSGVPGSNPTQREAIGGAHLRAANHPVRARQPGRGGLHRAGKRGDREWRAARA